MESDRTKWNERYSGEQFFFSLSPSRFLADSFAMVRGLVPGRRALDIACGEGRNALFLARHGFEVTAIDIAELGLDRGRRRAAELGVAVDFVRADLESYPLTGSYDLIVNFNFLLRPLIPELVACLPSGGVIVMETIMSAPSLAGEHRPDFLLQPGELERIFTRGDGSILMIEEEPTLEMPLARVIFRKS